jgi:pyruvate kinase
MIAKIVLEAESAKEEPIQRRRQHRQLSISETICESVAHAAQDLEMKAIAVYTESGTTARLISKYRPRATIYALAVNTAVIARINLMSGVLPLSCEMT